MIREPHRNTSAPTFLETNRASPAACTPLTTTPILTLYKKDKWSWCPHDRNGCGAMDPDAPLPMPSCRGMMYEQKKSISWWPKIPSY